MTMPAAASARPPSAAAIKPAIGFRASQEDRFLGGAAAGTGSGLEKGTEPRWAVRPVGLVSPALKSCVTSLAALTLVAAFCAVAVGDDLPPREFSPAKNSDSFRSTAGSGDVMFVATAGAVPRKML